MVLIINERQILKKNCFVFCFWWVSWIWGLINKAWIFIWYVFQTFQPLEFENREIYIGTYPNIPWPSPPHPLQTIGNIVFWRLLVVWFHNCKIDVGPADKHASKNLFCKTTGWKDGPLKENSGRELRKLTDHQAWSKNNFDFGTKLRFINPFPHASLKPTCVSVTWTLIFKLFQQPGDFDKSWETGRIHPKMGDSREKREVWNVWFFTTRFVVKLMYWALALCQTWLESALTKGKCLKCQLYTKPYHKKHAIDISPINLW